MAGISYDIVIKDFATGTLSKLQKSSLKTEGAVRKMMRGIGEGSKTASPSIDSLRFKLQKLADRRNASFDTRKIRLFNGAIYKTERQLRKLENLPPLSVSQRFRKIGTSMSATLLPVAGIGAAVAALAGAFKGAITTGAGFYKEMSNVKALTGSSGSTFNALTATARKMGATTAFSAREAAEGMSFLAQAGFDTAQITKALPAALNLAAAGGVGLGEAADISSNILSGFGLQAEQTGRVVDVMAKATSTSNTNITELGEAMKFFAPTAKTLGISLEESSAAVGLLGNAGIKGSLATNSLSTAFTRLAKGAGEVGKTSKKLGLELFKNGEFVGIASAVGQLEGAFVGMTQQQKAAHLSTLFGQEAFKNIAVLLDAGSEKIHTYTAELRNSRGVSKEMAETKLDNLAGEWTKLKSAVSELSISLYDTLRPALRLVVKVLSSTAAAVMRFGSWIKKNGKWIKTLAAGVITYVVAVKSAAVWTALVTKAKALWAAASALAALGQNRLSASTVLATIKQRIFNKVLLGNPYLAVAAVVLALGAAVATYASSVSNVSAAQQAQLDVASKTKASMLEEQTEAETLLAIFRDHKSTADQKTAAYNKLNDLYPSILGKYKDEKKALEDIDLLQNDIIESIKQRAAAEASYDLLVEAQRDFQQLKQEGAGGWDVAKGAAAGLLLGVRNGVEITLDAHLSKIKQAQIRVDKLAGINREATKKQLGNTQVVDAPGAAVEVLVGVTNGVETTQIPYISKTKEPQAGADVSRSADALVTGGKRQQVYNIQIGKVLEMGDQVITGGKEQADELVDTLLEALLRRMSGTFRSAAS